MVEVGVGTGPWSYPVRVISFVDLFIDVDVQGVLLCPTKDSLRRVVVFLSCEWPASNGSRIRLKLIVILRSWSFGLLPCKRFVGDLVILFRHGTVALF